MRLTFRVLLPLAHVAFTAALLLMSASQPQFQQASRCGDFDPSAYCLPTPIPTRVACFVELNLPAVPILSPLYSLLGGPDHPNLPVLIMLFGLAGIGIWFFVGQFLDDVAAAFLYHPVPRRRLYAGMFSVFLVISSCVVFVQSDITGFALSSNELVIRVCSLSWLVVGCATLLFRIGWRRRGTWRWGSAKLIFALIF
jgi:hypothetical protein